MHSFKSVIRILLLFLGVSAISSVHAAIRWVGPGGADNPANGTSRNAPYSTISYAVSQLPSGGGHTVNIMSGTYRETVVLPANVNGTNTTTGAVIFQADEFPAGTFANVVIHGAVPISTAWTETSAGSKKYFTSLPAGWATLGAGNQVFKSGLMIPEARWPNAIPASASATDTDTTDYPWQNSRLPHGNNTQVGDWSYVDTAGYTSGVNGYFTDGQLPSVTGVHANGYWVGAKVHIMSGAAWIMNHATVTAYTHSAKKITTNDNNGTVDYYSFKAGSEYYLTGKLDEMDSDGEWFFKPAGTVPVTATDRLYIYSNAAPGAAISIKQREYGFDLSGKKFITLKGLKFAACSIKTDTSSSDVLLDGLTMTYLGHNAENSATSGTLYGLVLRNNFTLQNSTLRWDSRGLLTVGGSNIKVINNKLQDSGYVPEWNAMVTGYGSANLISHNTMERAGRAAVAGVGRAAIIEYNDFSDAMKLTRDGGVFYAIGEFGNSVFRYNKMHDSIGTESNFASGSMVQGFYLDCLNSNWIIHHNLIYNLPGSAFQFNARHNFNMVFNNTCRNCLGNGGITTDALQDGETGTRVFNNIFDRAPFTGGLETWRKTDFRNNRFADPGFASATSFLLSSTSSALNQGATIPGITDVTPSVSVGVPDIGALESGGTDWTSDVGYKTTAPSPMPTYFMPTMDFANVVKDGSFESNYLPANWTQSGTSLSVINSASWVTGFQGLTRSGSYGLRFTSGTSEITQTVNGLKLNKRYKLYVAYRATANDPNVKLSLGIKSTSGVLINGVEVSSPTGSWEMVEHAFHTTGDAASSTLKIFVKVVSNSGNPVYVDDVGLELIAENTDPNPHGMPKASYRFDESSGATIAVSSSTTTANATLTSASIAAGGFGGGNAYTSSSGGYARASSVNVPSSGANASFTVAFRVKFNTSGVGTGTPLLASNTNGNSAVAGWYVQANYDRGMGMNLRSGSSFVSCWSGPSATVGEWAHVAFTMDRATDVCSMYREGVLTAVTAIPVAFDLSTTNGLQIGSTLLYGQIDDFQIWDYALSGNEIAALESPPSPAPQLRLKLNDPSGSTNAWDATGAARHGTLVNLPAATCWQNGALRFSQAGNYVQCPPLSANSPEGSFTVAMWVKYNDALGTPLLASNTNGNNTLKGWYIQTNPGRTMGMDLLNAPTSTPGYGRVSTWCGPSAIVGTWTHVAFTVDRTAGFCCAYRDGALGATSLIPANFGDVDTTNGPRIGSSALKADIKDFRIYSSALNATEVEDLFRQKPVEPYE